MEEEGADGGGASVDGGKSPELRHRRLGGKSCLCDNQFDFSMWLYDNCHSEAKLGWNSRKEGNSRADRLRGYM